jgi:ADP-heptose:LPS heptosyltransferase
VDPVPDHKRILVIKHGALGDFVLATGPFRAIRGHHPRAHLTLMTGPPFAPLGRACGWFDAVWEDSRPRQPEPARGVPRARRLRRGGFDRVYDLQNSDRTRAYFFLLGGRRREWSGIAPGCSHPHRNPERGRMHTLDRQAEQLAIAGIAKVPPPDLSWTDAEVGGFACGDAFALVVPGGAAHRPEKRWPAARYAEIARHLQTQGVRPVLIGGAAERAVLDEIAAATPGALNLGAKTNFAEIAALARRAHFALGNDTGPMHLIAACGCPSVVLFSATSDPARTAPTGAHVTVLRRPSLADLSAEDVGAALPLDRDLKRPRDAQI